MLNRRSHSRAAFLMVSVVFITSVASVKIAHGQQLITRTQILNNATPYMTFSWAATIANLKTGYKCSNRTVYYASNWVKVGTNSGMPYCYGGSSTMSTFSTDMKNQKSAGDICSPGPVGGNCTGLPLASCASGMDCSGFVQVAWGLPGFPNKLNVVDLGKLSTPINITDVKPGDILCLNDMSHVRLVESFDGTTIKYIESVAYYWKVREGHNTIKELTNYKPMRYNYVLDNCTTPSNISVTNITANSATVNLSSVPGGSQYQIGYKQSANSLYTFNTVSSLPILLTNLNSNTAYNYIISAYCPLLGNWSKYSSVNSFTTLSNTCSVPTNLHTIAITSTSFTIAWTAQNAASYNYFLKTGSQSTYTAYDNYTFNPVMFTNASPNTTYNFMISSNCINGVTSQRSAVITITTHLTGASNPGGKPSGLPSIDLSASQDDEPLSSTIYPNPVQAGKQLIIKSNSALRTVSLFSMDGKVLKTVIVNKTKDCQFLLPSNLSASIYLIKILSERGLMTQKVIVSKP